MRIYQLPTVVANQIAAGEVIERPASVVKELLENSLDAAADAITVEVGYGGLNYIKISDNGSGIVAEDLPLAIAAHATSKISRLDDLYSIESMGFRGEALASIAAVAKLNISSKPAAQEHAMMLQAKDSEFKILPCARAQGTTIEVIDLFFNAPVRKRFLKSEQLEFKAIEEVFKRFALSAPHISLTLKHNHKLIYSLPPASNEQAKQMRMTRLFGSPFVKDAIFLDVERGGMRLIGWISSPEYQRSQNDRQWVYINQRMVKDKLLQHALKQAYEDSLHPGRFPACLLYFSIPTNEVDVNVHPTKHEVRFQQPRLVHDFFTSELRKALAQTIATSEYPKIAVQTSWEIAEPVLSTSSFTPREYDTKRLKLVDDHSWVFLNTRHALIFKGSQPILVDVLNLYQQDLKQQLQNATLPLASRPLLVPIRYTFTLNNIPQHLQTTLAQLGIHIEFQAEKQMVVRTVPIIVPYLALKEFLEKAASLHTEDLDQWLQLLTETQLFDPKLLSLEERLHLQKVLIDTDKPQQGLAKVLSVENCRILLDD